MAGLAVRLHAGRAERLAPAHWGQPPAYGVPAKRVYTYRHALFRAEQLGIPFKMPPAHPFDSIKPLLLAVAAGGDIDCVREIFRFIWREGRDPSTRRGLRELCEHVGLPDGAKLIEQRRRQGATAAQYERTRSSSGCSACRPSG